MKALIEKGSVRRESGRWQRCNVDQLLIPQRVKEAIGNRLERVSQNCNEVLRVCAILGKVVTFEELSSVAEQSEDTLLDALDDPQLAEDERFRTRQGRIDHYEMLGAQLDAGRAGPSLPARTPVPD